MIGSFTVPDARVSFDVEEGDLGDLKALRYAAQRRHLVSEREFFQKECRRKKIELLFPLKICTVRQKQLSWKPSTVLRTAITST